MAQFLSQVPAALMQQQQRMTPQLIQAMDILQLNAMALESRIQQELDANPALEIVQPDDEVAPTPPAEPDPPTDQRSENEQALVVEEGSARDFERLDNLVREYNWIDDDEHRGSRSSARLSEEGDLKLEAMANTAARSISLQEYLLEQWHLADVDERTRELGERLIDALSENGLLETPLEVLAAEMSPPCEVSELERALARVQELDPPGIAARSLQECLLIQLELSPEENETEIAIVRDHFEDLQRNRLPNIARALQVSVEDVKAAIHNIGRLSLHPGKEVAVDSAPPILPDVIVEWNEEQGRYDVRLARSNQRDLRISNEFREALEQARGDKQAREFLKQKIDAANAIIDAIRYRRERLLDVARAAVNAQTEFLERGDQHLKVLRMSDLAAELGCDPSTISRTVDEKYLQTPRGIIPLRRFFTGGTEAENGDALGWDSIKAKVQEIVAHEDKTNPLNDDEIVERLRAEGIDIKRRTVAKYRAQLAIPTARQRRQY